MTASVHHLNPQMNDGGIPHDKRDKSPIVLPWMLCNTRVFAEAMEKLDNEGHKFWSNKTIFAFNKIKDAFESATKQYNVAFKKLVDKHCEWEEVTETSKIDPRQQVPVIDEKTGKPKRKQKMRMTRGGGRDWVWKDEAAWVRAFNELGAQTFSVKAFKLTSDELLAAGLSPKELRMCVIITEDADPDLLESFHQSIRNMLEVEDDEEADDETPTQESASASSDDAPD